MNNAARFADHSPRGGPVSVYPVTRQIREILNVQAGMLVPVLDKKSCGPICIDSHLRIVDVALGDIPAFMNERNQ
jgi:hypothetical protein